MSIRKILINKSGEEKKILGRSVANNDSYEIPFKLWLELADKIKEQNNLYTDINSGDIVVNDGTNDLSSSDGINHCELLVDINSIPIKYKTFIILNYNGSSSDLWLGFGDKLVPTNDSCWSPPFDCHIIQVQFSNKKSGTSSQKTINEIRCHSMDYSEDRSITTNDTTVWYVNNYDDDNLIKESGYGRTWEYDNSEEGDHLYKNKKYAFRIRNLEGVNPADILITLLVEEL